ncbi:MAG: Rid family hydrolase [Gemmatimonadales bacterium]
MAQDPAPGRLLAGDVTRQTEQIFQNLAALLGAAGKDFADVIRVGVFLTDIGDFQAMNAVYARYFEPPYPARTTVAVAALPLGAAIEIDLVAR